MKPPVYLYCLPDDLDLLRGKLRLQGLMSLQDPFITGGRTAPPENQRRVTEEEIRHEIRRQYEQLPAELAALGDFEYFLSEALRRRQDVEARILRAERKNPLHLPEAQAKQLMLARFYANPAHLGLWQQWGGGHTGFLIAVDTSHRFFTEKPASGGPQLFAPVRYRKTRPFEGEKLHVLAPALHRSDAFASEREWRLLRLMKEVGQATISVRFPVAAITRVILGACVSSQTKEKITSLVATDLHLKGVPVQQARLDYIHYRLVLPEADE